MTTEEFNIHYNNLRLTDQRMSDDLGGVVFTYIDTRSFKRNLTA